MGKKIIKQYSSLHIIIIIIEKLFFLEKCNYQKKVIFFFEK